MLTVVAIEILFEDYLQSFFGKLGDRFKLINFKVQNRHTAKISPPIMKPWGSKKMIIKLVAIILLVGIGAFYVTQPYISEVANYVHFYGPTGSVSTFTPEDLKMADWLKNNMPSNTLIISDPDTTSILCGLAGMPLTLTGRYYVNGLDTATIPGGKQSLFTEVLTTLNVNSLATLVKLYESSDEVMGMKQAFPIVVVINNRTTSWVSSSWQGYQYSNIFNSYEGLLNFGQNSLSKSLYNVSSSYLSYELSTPQLTTETGPNLTVQFDNSSTKQIATTEKYYDSNFPNFTISLSGSNQYIVKEISSNWLLDSLEADNNSLLNITMADNGKILSITDTDPENEVLIQWTTPEVLGNVTLNFVQWSNGWYMGPYSEPKVGALTYESIGNTFELTLANGVKGGYCSIYRNDLQISLNSKSVLLFEVNATSNAQLAFALISPATKTCLFLTMDYRGLQLTHI